MSCGPRLITSRPISTLSVAEPEGAVTRHLRVFCPMLGATAPVDRCVDCTMCDGFDPKAGPSGRPLVRCAHPPAAQEPIDPVVGTALARFAVAIRVDAVNAALGSPARTAPVPVVDADMRMVGVFDGERHLRLDDRGHSLAVDEQDSVHDALAQLARRHQRQAPVVSRAGTLVGVLDDLEALRALGTFGHR